MLHYSSQVVTLTRQQLVFSLIPGSITVTESPLRGGSTMTRHPRWGATKELLFAAANHRRINSFSAGASCEFRKRNPSVPAGNHLNRRHLPNRCDQPECGDSKSPLAAGTNKLPGTKRE